MAIITFIYTRRISHLICLALFVALLEDRVVLPVAQAFETKYFEDGISTKGNTVVSNLKDPLPTITLRKESLQRQRRRRLLQKKRRHSRSTNNHDNNNFIGISNHNAGAIEVYGNKKSACAASNRCRIEFKSFMLDFEKLRKATSSSHLGDDSKKEEKNIFKLKQDNDIVGFQKGAFVVPR